MIYFLYDAILFLASPFLIGYHVFRSLTRGRPSGLAGRSGRLSSEELMKIRGHETIWVHSVSVGETIAVKSLLESIRKRFPQKKIVLSNGTETGRSISLKLEEADLCIYFPFDFGFAVRKAMNSIRPSLIIIVETEIWPNFLKRARLQGVPVVLVNGRISDRSFNRYHMFRRIFRMVLKDFSALCMQTDEDARRIAAIGAEPSKVHVAGNLKYDVPVKRISGEGFASLRDSYRIPRSVSVFTAGSTHQGEEELVIRAYLKLSPGTRDLFMVLVPRHPERAAKVCEILQGEGLSYTLRSRLDERNTPFRSGEVLVVDTIGELTKLYSVSDLVFVGGSLVPVGGHNILEPVSFHVPVLFGPYMHNFKEIASLVLRFKCGAQVADENELTDAMRGLLENEGKRRDMGRNGAFLLEENSGSIERHLAVIASFL